MSTATIYLAGGCYWGVEKYMSCLKGVLETEVGFANGNTHAPTYQQVRYENTGHAETVRVVYDPAVLPLKAQYVRESSSYPEHKNKYPDRGLF